MAQERMELGNSPEAKRAELSAIYVARGLDVELAARVAAQLTVEDELGLSEGTRARPNQAAFSSAGAFVSGAAVELLLMLFVPLGYLTEAVFGGSILLLVVLDGLAAPLGGAIGVTLGGVVAMGCTVLVGKMFGTVV